MNRPTRLMLAALAAILAGCEAMPQRSPTEPTAEPVTTVGEVGDPPNRPR